MTNPDLLPVHVGDHVQDREDDDGATMVVTGAPPKTADETIVSGAATVADKNPTYPADDAVIEVVFPERTDVDLSSRTEYSYPRSRLELVATVHDRDEGEDDDGFGTTVIENAGGRDE